MRISMLCVLGALLPAATPAWAEKQSWSFIKSGSAALLVYGVPESHAVTLSFICEPKKKTIDIVTTMLPRNAKQDHTGIIKLSNGPASVEYAGKVGRDNEDSGLHFAAATPIDPQLFDVLDKGPSIRIEALGASGSVPLAGVKKPLTQMRQACR